MISRSMLSEMRPPGLRHEPGDFPVDLPLAPGLEGVGQTAAKSLELGADAVCNWRRAIPAMAEIFAVHRIAHRTNLRIDRARI